MFIGMDITQFFKKFSIPQQRLYEAMRAVYVDNLTEDEVLARFGLSRRYFQQATADVAKKLELGETPFFVVRDHKEIIQTILYKKGSRKLFGNYGIYRNIFTIYQ